MPPALINKKLIIAILVIAFIGFLDATYLTVKHYQEVIPPCTLTEGCEAVLTSKYNNFFGIPVALFGSLYYLAIFFGTFAYLNNTSNTKLLTLTARATWLGFVTSLYFAYLQIFIIKSLCIYCLFSALTSILIFILGQMILQKTKLWVV